MPLSTLFLALLLFLLSAGWLDWFIVENLFLGIIALFTAILLIFEGTPVYTRLRRG